MSKQLLNAAQRSLLPSIVILAFVIAYIVTSYLTLDAISRWVPLLAAAATLALVSIEIVRCVFRVKAGDTASTTHDNSASPPTTARAVTAIAYVVAGVATIYLLGFLPALPLYLFASIAVLGRQSSRVAAIVAVVTSLVIYAVFEIALGYELYRGLFFS